MTINQRLIMKRINSVQSDSRVKRVALASVTGILFSIISLFLSLLLRKVFITRIGVEYLGLYTFLAELFGLLTAVDGGVCSSLFIKIHKPIADKDENEVARIYKLIKIVYSIRSVLVIVIGCILFFALSWLSSDVEISIKEIRIAYVIYLIINASSYLFIYNQFILEAYQKRYISNIVTFGVTVVFTIINMVMLECFKSFYIYLSIQVSISLAVYIVCTFLVKKKYPALRQKAKVGKNAIADIKDMFGITYYTLSNIVVRNTDNILITKLLGFSVNGVYSSYKMLNSQVFNLINKVKYAVQDSSRNYIVSKKYDESFVLLNRITYLYFWIGGFCTVALSTLSTPFIILWLGNDYTLNVVPVFLTVLTLCIELIIYPYEDAFYSLELYKENKYVPIVEIAINLIVSIIAGLFWGISGIMIGTIAYLAFKTVSRVKIIAKKYKEVKATRLIARYLMYYLIIFISFLITFLICNLISNNSIGTFLVKICIVLVLPNIVFFITTSKLEEQKWARGLLLNYLKKWRNRNE